MNGKVIIISAPSGSGKSTIINYLLEQNLPLQFAVSATSRPPRGNEKNGVEYYFLSLQAFKKKIREDEFIEYEEVYKDTFYGSLKSEVERILSGQNHVLFDLDVKGGSRIKKKYKEKSLSVFIMPPSMDELRKRLYARGTDSPEMIELRLERVKYELGFASEFDVVIINDVLEKAQIETFQAIQQFIHSK
ncbi:MAG: guanylate kinase [Tannerella sp.]|jgi:guanylate kinase|nr:guanylate kinase [Tannerella sp.]